MSNSLTPSLDAGQIGENHKWSGSNELLFYLLAATMGLGVDGGLLIIFVQFLGVGHMLANVASFLAGALVVYVLSIKIVFLNRRVRNTAVEFLIFLALGTAGLAVTLSVTWIGIDLFSLDFRLTKLAAAGASFITNFLIRKSVLFSIA